jgi:flagellar protein FliS
VTIAAEYLETQVLTASPHRLHLMVLDGALRFIRRGMEALELQRWEDMDAALTRGRNCLSELIGGLDPSQSFELVEPLKALFVFAYRSVTLGDLERDPQRLHDAVRVLELHRATWLELGERLRPETTSSVPTPHTRSWLS